MLRHSIVTVAVSGVLPKLLGVGLLVLLGPTALAATTRPTVTFVEGASTIVSGGRARLPAPGVLVHPCDAFITGPSAIVQVEYEDGSAVLVGPETRFVFDLPAVGVSPGGSRYLHSGWAKVTTPSRTQQPPQRVGTPLFDLEIDAGVAVLHAAPEGVQVYVERGEAGALLPPARVVVGTGFTFSRMSRKDTGSLLRGVEPDFARAMPVPLRDSLPMLLSRLKAHDVEARPAPGKAADESWLATTPDLHGCSIDDNVRSAQEALARSGFDVGPVDGVLGPRTQEALRAFQQVRGLPPTGQLDAATRQALGASGVR